MAQLRRRQRDQLRRLASTAVESIELYGGIERDDPLDFGLIGIIGKGGDPLDAGDSGGADLVAAGIGNGASRGGFDLEPERKLHAMPPALRSCADFPPT